MGNVVKLSDIAKEAGVTTATVSMVLNPSARARPISEPVAQRIRHIADRLGYEPNWHAQAMRKGFSASIAIAFDVGKDELMEPERSQLSYPYFGTLVGAIEMENRHRGYDTVIVGPAQQMTAIERALRGLRAKRFDGVILLGMALQRQSERLIEDMSDLPAVVVEYSGQTRLPVVTWDEAHGVKLAVSHLAEMGHREILWVGPDMPANTQSPGMREYHFMNAVYELGLHGSLCRFHQQATYYEPTIAAVYDAVVRWLKEKPRTFSGIVCYNDVVGIGACRALLDSGLRVPADVSVVGMDDVLASLCCPPLTTVSHGLGAMGSRASELAVRMACDRKLALTMQNERDVVPGKLVLRSSTGPCKAGKIP